MNTMIETQKMRDLVPTPKLHSREEANAFVERCKAAGFDFIRFEMADMAGLSRGKTIPIGHVASYMRSGLNLYGGTVALDSYSVPVRGSGYNEEMNYTDCVMVVDTGTLTPVPWLERTGRVLCDTMWYDGKPQMACPRLLLQKMIGIAATMGYVVKMGHEYEFYVVDAKTRAPIFNGQPIFVTHRTHEHPAIDGLIRVLQAQGIDIITWNVEHGPGQVEINYEALDGIAAADCAFVFKNTVKEYLSREGLMATFMTKPYKGLSGSCSHFHVSLIDAKTGQNAFLDGGRAPWHVRPDALLHPGHHGPCPRSPGDLEPDAELLSPHPPAHLCAVQHLLGRAGPFRQHPRQGQLRPVRASGGARAVRDVQPLSGGGVHHRLGPARHHPQARAGRSGGRPQGG